MDRHFAEFGKKINILQLQCFFGLFVDIMRLLSGLK